MHGSAFCRKALYVLVLAALSAAAPGTAGAQAVQPPGVPVELRSNEPDLYPGRFDVVLRSLERLPSGIGLRAELASDMKAFSHFVYSTNQAPFRKIKDGVLVIAFEDRHSPDVQKTETAIRAVGLSGGTSREFSLAVNFYPRELYAAAGQTAPGYVIVQRTDVPILTSRVADWIVDAPLSGDAEFARETWGAKVRGATSSLERARRLARAILDDLDPHRGTPSDAMNAAPFEQYRRAASGRDRVWCSNLAEVFVRACSCFDIPARAIKMIRYGSQGKDYDFLMAEGHETTEVFDEASNRWVWIDLTFQMTGMELAGRGPVSMAELHRALNDPDLVKGLTSLEYDSRAMTESRVSLPASGKLASLLNFFKRDQTFTYYRRPRK